MHNKTILIFADANRRASITAARILKKQGCRLIFAVEANFPKRLTNVLFRTYSSSHILSYPSDNFIDFLNDVADQYGEYEILPIGEWHIRQILSNKKQLSPLIKICINDLDSYNRLSNKISFTHLCQQFQIDLPKELSAYPQSYEQKFVVKPKNFEKQERILTVPFLVDSLNQFDALKEQNIDPSKHFYQEYIEGPSIYYCAFYKQGHCLETFTQFNNIQQPNGKSVIKAQPFSIATEVCSKINSIFKYLHWTGPMMFELKRCNRTHKLYAIECNPRLWGPIQLAADNGVDFISPCINLPPLQPLQGKKYGYLWLSGFVHGYLLERQSKQGFQIYASEPTAKVAYKDLYLRKGSVKYFIVEMLFNCQQLLKYLCAP